MNPAYRIAPTPNGNERPDALSKVTVPITRVNLRSFFTMPTTRVALNAPTVLQGFAFDGGDGIRSVEVSEAGKTWQAAMLGADLGGFSFRRWRLEWKPTTPGTVSLQVRATSNSGETQPTVEGWNRSGYMRNVIERITLDVT
jgi:sulfite dehydrogenase (cytochrome) subunit A